MKSLAARNLANIIVLGRILLVFVVVWLWSAGSEPLRGAGVLVLVLAFLLDGLDGWVARRMGSASRLGGLMDTMGDRITENVLLVFLAYQRLIPLFVPLVFISRSFAADLIRHLNDAAGESTFSINRSWLGRWLVASTASRVLYLGSKMALFFFAGAFWVGEVHPGSDPFGDRTHDWRILLAGLSVVLAVFNLLRFGLLVWDSRQVLAAAMSSASGAPEPGSPS
ncbi:MAG: CDP-alcohol phosphatidyltransferase family protein [Elusimicrobiota bacterium]